MKTRTLIALATVLAAGAATAQTLRPGEAAWPEDGPVPLAAPAAPATRASVVEALTQARRDGELLVAGELGLAPAELRSEHAAVYGRTRQDVQAELAQARRAGDQFAVAAGSGPSSGSSAANQNGLMGATPSNDAAHDGSVAPGAHDGCGQPRCLGGGGSQ